MGQAVIRLLPLLLLTGCSPWYVQSDFRPTSIVIHSVPDVANRCAVTTGTVTGCTFRINESKTAHVFIADDLTQDLWTCTLTHEVKHAAGYGHFGNVWEC